MSDTYDKEIEAIGACLNALGPLDPKSRQAVLKYVSQRLEITTPAFDTPALDTPPDAPLPGEHSEKDASAKDECHISELVEQKKPRSAIEMAVLVAYYLSHKAAKSARKQTISTEDLTTYFKIADFKLPSSPQYTLPNTKNAGYLDSAGGGEYKLNPVGYNLVVHSMPKTGKADARKRPAKKKASKSKALKPKASKA